MRVRVTHKYNNFTNMMCVYTKIKTVQTRMASTVTQIWYYMT